MSSAKSKEQSRPYKSWMPKWSELKKKKMDMHSLPGPNLNKLHAVLTKRPRLAYSINTSSRPKQAHQSECMPVCLALPKQRPALSVVCHQAPGPSAGLNGGYTACKPLPLRARLTFFRMIMSAVTRRPNLAKHRSCSFPCLHLTACKDGIKSGTVHPQACRRRERTQQAETSTVETNTLKNMQADGHCPLQQKLIYQELSNNVAQKKANQPRQRLLPSPIPELRFPCLCVMI